MACNLLWPSLHKRSRCLCVIRVHILWMPRLFVVRFAALWMLHTKKPPKNSNANGALFVLDTKWRPGLQGSGGRSLLRRSLRWCIIECGPLQGVQHTPPPRQSAAREGSNVQSRCLTNESDIICGKQETEGGRKTQIWIMLAEYINLIQCTD